MERLLDFDCREGDGMCIYVEGHLTFVSHVKSFKKSCRCYALTRYMLGNLVATAVDTVVQMQEELPSD